MKGWKIAAAVGALALSVGGVSLAAPGAAKGATKPGAAKSSLAQGQEVAAKKAEALMTQLKMTEDQKKRARKVIANTQTQIKKIDAEGGTDQQKQQKAMPVLQKLREEMAKILTPEQNKQLAAMQVKPPAGHVHQKPGSAPLIPRPN